MASQNVGEEVVGAYLQAVKGCEFLAYNLHTRDTQPDNVRRLVGKFLKDIAYARKYFRGYKRVFMLWSPIVRDTRPGSKHNQMRDVDEIKRQLRKSGISLQVIVNEDFKAAIDALKRIARDETKELKSSVMRLFQIEAKLNDHLTSA